MSQSTSAAVHTFCERQKPIPDGAGQYYVAGTWLSRLNEQEKESELRKTWLSNIIHAVNAPGHLPVKLRDYNNRLRVLVATYVTFSPDGTELLVNMGGEQVMSVRANKKTRRVVKPGFSFPVRHLRLRVVSFHVFVPCRCICLI